MRIREANPHAESKDPYLTNTPRSRTRGVAPELATANDPLRESFCYAQDDSWKSVTLDATFLRRRACRSPRHGVHLRHSSGHGAGGGRTRARALSPTAHVGRRSRAARSSAPGRFFESKDQESSGGARPHSGSR